MRLIEVLPNYEAKRFDKPPVLTQDERKSCFQVDLSISSMMDKTKQDINKVGLLLQYGYFKVTGCLGANPRNLRSTFNHPRIL